MVRLDEGGEIYSNVPRFEGVADEEHENGGGGPEYVVVGLGNGAVEMVKPDGSPLRWRSTPS